MITALELLAHGESVSNVADAVGYETPSSFIAAFRDSFGTTPTAYFQDAGDRRLMASIPPPATFLHAIPESSIFRRQFLSQHGAPPCVVWVRCGNVTNRELPANLD